MSAGIPTIPVSQLAKLLMISERRIQQLVLEGVIPKTEHGRYELAPAVQGYIKYLQNRATMAGADDGGARTFREGRGRKLDAEAQLAELKVQQMMGQLIDADEVVRAWQEILKQVKAGVMAVPQRMGSLFGHLTRLELNALDRELRDALAVLAKGETASDG